VKRRSVGLDANAGSAGASPSGRNRSEEQAGRFKSQYGPFVHFASKVRFDTCWVWIGQTDKDGYGKYYRQGRTFRAHRFAYQLLVGPIPPGLTIDHLCRNPGCTYPAHMECVTIRENTLRGLGPTAQVARRTHCPLGHPYDLFNTKYRRQGGRACRACIRLAHAKETERRRQIA